MTTEQFFELALKHHQDGRLDEAARLYSAFLDINPEHAHALHLLGVLFSQQGDVARAEKNILKAIRLDPLVAVFHNNLGHILLQEGRGEEAVASFSRAVELDPAYLDAFRNLSACLLSEGNMEQAVIALTRAFALAPEDGVLANDLANLYKDLGFFAEAEALYVQALARKPNDLTILYNQALLYFTQTPASAWEDLCEKLLKFDAWSALYLYEWQVRRCIGAWLCGKKQNLKSFLGAAEETFLALGQTEDKNVQNMRAYQKYLMALVQKGTQMPEVIDAPELALVGDSHVLSYAGQSVTWGGKVYKTVPYLVMGAKAWHMAKDGQSHYKKALQNILKGLGHSVPCLLFFGEIDCRYGEGLLVYQKKQGGDLSDIAARTVQGYVKAVSEMLEGSDRVFAFANVPAPNLAFFHQQIESFSQEDAVQLQRVVTLFNEVLEKEASGKIIDFYGLTKESKSSCHIDTHHLFPSVLGRALQR